MLYLLTPDPAQKYFASPIAQRQLRLHYLLKIQISCESLKLSAGNREISSTIHASEFKKYMYLTQSIFNGQKNKKNYSLLRLAFNK